MFSYIEFVYLTPIFIYFFINFGKELHSDYRQFWVLDASASIDMPHYHMTMTYTIA